MSVDIPHPVTIEIDDVTTISIVFSREWPKLMASWSVRVQSGESDYPLAAGSADAMPPRDGDLEPIWEGLRQRAEAEARAAVDARRVSAPAPKPGLLSRILGRKS